MQLEGTQNAGEIEELQAILIRKQGRPIDYDEALEVGESLISFFKTLANQDGIDGGEQDN